MTPTIVPTKISHGDLWATKTYQHAFVESPDGGKLLYRYFADPQSQPPDVRDPGHGAQMWLCGPDGSGRRKLFDIPDDWHESGHGSESMIWIDDDRFYYNGLLFDTKDDRVVWRIPNPVEPRREISAWSEPVRGELFVNIRTGSNAGYYALDPYAETAPALRRVIGREDLRPFLGGDPDEYQFTYILLSNGGSHLFFVIHFHKEIGFTCKCDGSDIVVLGNTDTRLLPWNGHTVWIDDERLVFPADFENTAKCCDRFGGGLRAVAARSGHITVSPDLRWLASDDYTVVRLFRFGELEPVARLMTDDQVQRPGVKIHTHPSFSRDSKRVYFAGRNGAVGAVYRADVPERI